MGFIDCDSHVMETEATWEYLSAAEQRFKPMIMRAEDAATSGPTYSATSSHANAVWVVDDTWCTAVKPDGNHRGNANIFDPAATALEDVSARVKDLDALGIDAQLVLSTFFIGIELHDPIVEVALSRCWNRWVADRIAGYEDRLPWAMRVPLRTPEAALKEMEFAKEHGAAGIQVRGKELGTYLSDPIFDPIYARAQDLDLAICVHLGEAHRTLENQPIGKLIHTPEVFVSQVHNNMIGFHSILSSDVSDRFPRLRFAFIEAGATWVPFVLQQHARFNASREEFLHLNPVTPEEMEAKNLYITCVPDEDLAYLTGLVGENVLCTGTDYGHNDAGSELGGHYSIMNRTDLSEEARRKIVSTNGRKLLGLDPTDGGVLPTELPASLPHVRGAETADERPLFTRELVS